QIEVDAHLVAARHIDLLRQPRRYLLDAAVPLQRAVQMDVPVTGGHDELLAARDQRPEPRLRDGACLARRDVELRWLATELRSHRGLRDLHAQHLVLDVGCARNIEDHDTARAQRPYEA